jgi:hypothetical protein
MRRNARTTAAILALLGGLLAIGIALAQTSTSFDLGWNVFGGGGGDGGSANFALSGTAGQPALGTATSDGYRLDSGFWGRLASPDGTGTPTPTPTPTPPAGFADLPETHWSHPFVQAITDAGITNGCSTDPPLYCPDDPVNRAMMAVFIIRALEETQAFPTGTVFSDVSAGYWAAGYIERLAELQITSGFGDGTYRPDQSVTRAQMATFLVRALELDPVDPASGTVFTDVSAAHWAAGYIERLAAEGISVGFGDGTYKPDIPVSRAQMAAFLTRAWDLV